MPRFLRDRPRLTTALVLAALIGLATWPLWQPGALINTRGGGDSPFLLQRTQQLAAALRDGHFPARWMPDAAYGYGYPFFNFYAPLSIYVAAGFHLLGLGLVGAIQAAQLAGFAVAGWGAYNLGRRWWTDVEPGPSPAGLLAAVAYTTAPFHLVNVYVRGDSLAEFWAMAFYPLTLLAADHLLAAKRPVGAPLAVFALAYGGLVLSHNISALLFSPFLLLYLLLRRRAAGDAAGPGWLVRVGPGLALGLILSAWFWLPALAERSLAQLEPVTSGYFFYGNHFRSDDLVQGELLFDYDVEAGRDPFRLGLAQTLAAAGGLLALVMSRGSRPDGDRRLFIGLALAGALFMITPLSRPVWDNLPLLPFTQFPWRFLSIAALAGALATGGLAALPGRPPRALWPALAVSAALLATALGDLRPDTLRLEATDVTPERLAQYEWFTGNIGSTVSGEYLPPAARPRPWTSGWLQEGVRDGARVLAGAAEATPVSRETTRQAWAVRAGTDGARLLLPTFYWPGWRAEVEGPAGGKAAASLMAMSGSGLMIVDVPAGEHTLRLRLGRTPIRLAAELLSLAGLLVAAWLLKGYANRRAGRQLLLAAALLALVGLGARLWPRSAAAPDDLTWDVAQIAYLSRAESAVPFANGAHLDGYALSAESVAPGETLTVTLNWAAGPAGEAAPARLALVTPADTRPGQTGGVTPPALAETAVPATPGSVATRLAVPASAPAGLYLPRLTFADATALTPTGRARGPLYLRPIRVLPGAPPAEAPAEMPVAVRVTEAAVADDALHLDLAWWTDAPLSASLAVSLRLTDRDGLWLAQFDTLPGYGYRPSLLWPARAWTPDRLSLSLDGVPTTGGPHGVVLQLYDAPGGRVWLTRRLGELVAGAGGLAFRATEPLFAVPPDLSPLDAAFGPGQIALRGFTWRQSAEQLDLVLVWEALAPGVEDYHHFVHLVDAQTGAIPAQDDAMPRRNSYPTSQWSAGEIVLDPLALDLRGVPAGDYRLAVGLYRLEDGATPRLPAVDAAGAPLPDDGVWLPVSVSVP